MKKKATKTFMTKMGEQKTWFPFSHKTWQRNIEIIKKKACFSFVTKSKKLNIVIKKTQEMRYIGS